MKAKKELNALKEEVETVNKKLHELTDEELAQVSGGCNGNCYSECHHDGFATAISGFCVKGQFDEVSCHECVHWIGPEGPCELD